MFVSPVVWKSGGLDVRVWPLGCGWNYGSLEVREFVSPVVWKSGGLEVRWSGRPGVRESGCPYLAARVWLEPRESGGSGVRESGCPGPAGQDKYRSSVVRCDRLCKTGGKSVNATLCNSVSP